MCLICVFAFFHAYVRCPYFSAQLYGPSYFQFLRRNKSLSIGCPGPPIYPNYNTVSSSEFTLRSVIDTAVTNLHLNAGSGAGDIHYADNGLRIPHGLPGRARPSHGACGCGYCGFYFFIECFMFKVNIIPAYKVYKSGWFLAPAARRSSSARRWRPAN